MNRPHQSTRGWYRLHISTIAALLVVPAAVAYCEVQSLATEPSDTNRVSDNMEDAIQEQQSQTKLLKAIAAGELSKEQMQAAVADLVPLLQTPHRPMTLATLSRIFEQYPDIFDTELVAFAQLLHEARAGTLQSEAWLCRLLQALAIPRRLPEPVIDQLDAIFSHQPEIQFAAPKAAALLLKHEPSRQDIVPWFKEKLKADERDARMRAADALGWVGNSAQGLGESLHVLLNDRRVAVRVVAANALLRMEGSSPEIAEVLSESLTIPSESVVVVPITVSEWTMDHRHLAVESLRQIGKGAGIAAENIAKLLADPDDVLRSSAARALGKLDSTSPTVMEALLQAQSDQNAHVREAARSSLSALRNN